MAIEHSIDLKTEKQHKKATHACIKCQQKKCKCVKISTLINGKTTCKECIKKNLHCIYKQQQKRGPLNITTAKDTSIGLEASSKVQKLKKAKVLTVVAKKSSDIGANTELNIGKKAVGSWIHKTNTLPNSLLNLPLDSDSETEETKNNILQAEINSTKNLLNGAGERNGESLFEYLLYGYSEAPTTNTGAYEFNGKKAISDKREQIIKDCLTITNKLSKSLSNQAQLDVISLETLLKQLK